MHPFAVSIRQSIRSAPMLEMLNVQPWKDIKQAQEIWGKVRDFMVYGKEETKKRCPEPLASHSNTKKQALGPAPDDLVLATQDSDLLKIGGD